MKKKLHCRGILFHLLLLAPEILLTASFLAWILLVRPLYLALLPWAGTLVAYMIWLRPKYQFFLTNRLILSAYRWNDIDTYRNVLRSAGFDGDKNPYWLSASYETGDYRFVVDYCTYALRHPHRRQPSKYVLLQYLAGVYARTGDNQKLAEVCRVYDDWATKEPSPERTRYLAPVFARHKAYLAADETAWQELMAKEYASKAEQLGQLFFGARFAYDVKQDAQAARELFCKVIELCPGSALAMHARYALGCIDRGVPYGTDMPEILPREDFTPLPSRRAIVFISLRISCLLLTCLLCIFSINPVLDAQYRHWIEKLCVPAVKQTHVDAEFLTFLQINTETEFIADLCLYEVNGDVWVGELYVRTNHMDVPLLSPSVAIAVDLLEDPSKMPATLEVPGFLNDVTIMCMIYREQADIPSIFNVYEPFELNGHTYYFVITEIYMN